MTQLLFACAAIGALWTLLSIVALLARRPPQSAPVVEPITVLKPLRGAEPGLEENLRTFFEQDFASFELVFGAEGRTDAALPIVERLRREYPSVRSRVVVHDGGSELNPKVRNLLAMLVPGSHDVVVISDSNIRVRPDYLARALQQLQQPRVGLVTHPIAGSATDRMASVLEASYLNTQVIAAIAVATHVFKHAAVVGKSMMFRRSVLDALGGLGSLSNVLAEDYVMGRMFQHAGLKVVLSDDVVVNTCTESTLQGVVDRITRWSMIRARVQPLGYLLEPLSSPLLILAMSPWLPNPMVLAATAIGLLLLRDALTHERLGLRMTWVHLAVAIPRELIWLYAWTTALGHRHVAWRGHRLRVSAGTRLYRVSL